MTLELSPRTIAARAIAGPARIDDRGNRMDPGTQAVLRLIGALPLPRPWQMEPEVARAAFERQVRLLDPVRPDVAEVRTMGTDGMDAPVPLRVYRPRTDGPLPILVWFHGGGMVVGSLDSHDGLCRRLATGADAIVVAVDYRRAPEHKFPGPLEDSVVAFRWVAAHAAALGGHPARVAVGGDSGGGGLAAAVAHRARDDAEGPQPFAQVLAYPSVDATGTAASHRLFAENAYPDRRLKRWYLAHHLRHPDDALHPDASPLRSPRFDGLAAAVVAIAGFDPMRDEGEQYAANLREAGVEVTEISEPHLVHGYLNTPRLRAAREAGRRLVAAARRVLHRPATTSGQTRRRWTVG